MAGEHNTTEPATVLSPATTRAETATRHGDTEGLQDYIYVEHMKMLSLQKICLQP